MAGFVFKDAYVMVNTDDWSSYITDISFPLATAALNSTAMGDDSEEFTVGLKSSSFTLTLKQDAVDDGLNEQIYDIWNGAAAVAFVLKPNGDTTAATNPKFTGNCILTDWDPMAGSVGDLAKVTLNFQVSGDVTRAVSDP